GGPSVAVNGPATAIRAAVPQHRQRMPALAAMSRRRPRPQPGRSRRSTRPFSQANILGFAAFGDLLERRGQTFTASSSSVPVRERSFVPYYTARKKAIRCDINHTPRLAGNVWKGDLRRLPRGRFRRARIAGDIARGHGAGSREARGPKRHAGPRASGGS